MADDVLDVERVHAGDADTRKVAGDTRNTLAERLALTRAEDDERPHLLGRPRITEEQRCHLTRLRQRKARRIEDGHAITGKPVAQRSAHRRMALLLIAGDHITPGLGAENDTAMRPLRGTR